MIHVLSAAVADAKKLDGLRFQADFRKSTRNMMLAWLALRDALDQCGQALDAQSAIVLGSSYGELDTTKEFLKTLSEQKLARPLLFQNSLHNATVGFLAMRLGFTGITMSVSNRYFTGEDSIGVATDLLESGMCSRCAVVGVDTRVDDLDEAMTQAYPPGIRLTEGAAALVLASDGPDAIATIRGIEYRRAKRELGREEIERVINPFYDSDAIARIAGSLRSGNIAGTRLLKPDGTETRIELERSLPA